jgi:hypothetical protein
VADRIWASATDVHAKQTRISTKRDSCLGTSASSLGGFPRRLGVAPLLRLVDRHRAVTSYAQRYRVSNRLSIIGHT